LVDIWYEDVSGDKGVSGKRFLTFDLDPVTMTPNCIIFPFRSIIPKRLKSFGVLFGGRMYQGIKVCRAKNSCRATFELETEIPFRSVSPKRMKIFG
jgi:hypothetical protein